MRAGGGRQRCAPQTSGDRVTTDRRAAVPLVAALGALPRFARPRARRQVLGLLPAAPASGAPRRQGAMPPAGPLPHLSMDTPVFTVGWCRWFGGLSFVQGCFKLLLSLLKPLESLLEIGY